MADDKRAPGTDEERAARLKKMMESQLKMDAPEAVGLKTGYKCARLALTLVYVQLIFAAL